MEEIDLDAASERLVQQGWKVRQLPGFIGTAGPLWTRRTDAGWAYGVLCGPQHLNPARVAHGGLMATLLDHALSTAAWELCGRVACVTLQLDIHYLAAVRVGEFVVVAPQLVHRTASLLFMRGDACVDLRPVASAQAVLKAVGREPA